MSEVETQAETAPPADAEKSKDAPTKSDDKEVESKPAKKSKSENGAPANGNEETSEPPKKKQRSAPRPAKRKGGPPIPIPKWCGFPPWHKRRRCRLEVWKDGAKSSKDISLMKKPYFVLGREDTTDIRLDHNSISRKHCIILHHKTNGTIHMMDLKSAHGTQYNGNKCPPHKMGSLAEGGKLKFGASTRSYVIKGTAQVERETRGSIGPSGPPKGHSSQSRERRESEREARQKASNGGYETVTTVRKALTPAARLLLRRKQQEREAQARKENLRKLAGNSIMTGLTVKVVPLNKPPVAETQATTSDAAGSGMVAEEEADTAESAANEDGADEGRTEVLANDMEELKEGGAEASAETKEGDSEDKDNDAEMTNKE